MRAAEKIQFVAAGEVLIDFISQEPRTSLAASASFGKFFGGAPANVAANMQRLGVPSTLISRVGNDGLGTFLTDRLQELGIDTSYVTRDPLVPTSMVVLTQGMDTAEFIAYRQADTQLTRKEIPDELLLGSRIFHTTAHGIARRPTRDAILDAFRFAHAQGKWTSFDPNYSALFWPDRDDAMATLAQFLSVTTFTKPSRDDGERIFGRLSDEGYIDRFHAMGARNVLFTRGSEGSILSTEDGKRRVFEALPLPRLVDQTGAGDAFTAGFFSAYLHTGDPHLAMQVGAKTPCFSLGYLGALTPLPPLAHFL